MILAAWMTAVCLTAACLPGVAQDRWEFPLLDQAELPGVRVTLAGRYDGMSLAGYINGGAELYREYGFEALAVQEVQAPGEVVVEITRMRDAAAAFGMFSISRHGCEPADSMPEASCVSAYQILCATGPWFIRIMNGDGSPAARAASRRCAHLILNRTGIQPFERRGIFSRTPFDTARGDRLLIRGPLGVQNGLADWWDLLEGASEYTLEALRLLDPEGVVAELTFRQEADADVLGERLGVSPKAGGVQVSPLTGPRRHVVWLSPLQVRILESDAPEVMLAPYLDVLASPVE